MVFTTLQELILDRTPVSDLAPLTDLTTLHYVYVESKARRATLARTLGKRGENCPINQDFHGGMAI